MKQVELEKRITELERRVKELEAQPKEQHTHFHTHPPVYVQPYVPPVTPTWTWEPWRVTSTTDDLGTQGHAGAMPLRGGGRL